MTIPLGTKVYFTHLCYQIFSSGTIVKLINRESGALGKTLDQDYYVINRDLLPLHGIEVCVYKRSDLHAIPRCTCEDEQCWRTTNE